MKTRHTSVLPEFAVVFDWYIALLLKLIDSVDCQLLAMRLTEGLCPSELARISLHLERFVALRSAKAEDLAVIAHKADAVARVDGRGAEVALF